MAYNRLTAAEAAALINDGDYIGLGGFTPNGVPKAVFRELSKRAIAEHDAGRPFQVGILTGASSLQSVEGDKAFLNGYICVGTQNGGGFNGFLRFFSADFLCHII